MVWEMPSGAVGLSMQHGPLAYRQKAGRLSAALAFGQLPFEHTLGEARLSIENFTVQIPSLLGGVTQ